MLTSTCFPFYLNKWDLNLWIALTISLSGAVLSEQVGFKLELQLIHLANLLLVLSEQVGFKLKLVNPSFSFNAVFYLNKWDLNMELAV